MSETKSEKKMKTLEEIKGDIEEIEVTKNEVKNRYYSDSEKRKMMKQLDEILEKLKKEERGKMFYGDWSHMRWFPREKGEYIIHVLPKNEEHEGSWFLEVNKHFVT